MYLCLKIVYLYKKKKKKNRQKPRSHHALFIWMVFFLRIKLPSETNRI